MDNADSDTGESGSDLSQYASSHESSSDSSDDEEGDGANIQPWIRLYRLEDYQPQVEVNFNGVPAGPNCRPPTHSKPISYFNLFLQCENTDLINVIVEETNR